MAIIDKHTAPIIINMLYVFKKVKETTMRKET